MLALREFCPVENRTLEAALARTIDRIVVILIALMGVALIVRGVWGGLMPISVQLIAGVVLVLFAGVRWKMLS